MSRKHLLYIQHAEGMGGSVMSLLYTLQGLDAEKFQATVILARPAPTIQRLYKSYGYHCYYWPGIVLLHHSTVVPMPLYHPGTWLHGWAALRGWHQGVKSMQALLDKTQADLVHLNSMPLSNAAWALNRIGFPYVWHVREPPPDQGIRTRIIRRLMHIAPKMIFISRTDRRHWMKSESGEVLYNYVNFRVFDKNLNKLHARETLEVRKDCLVLLYMGGFSVLKGILVLLHALAKLKDLPFRVLMPATVYESRHPSRKVRIARRLLPRLGSGTQTQKAERLIQKHGLDDYLLRLPYTDSPAHLFAASDLLLFPAIRPHFPRPVIEAGAMAKPSIASDLEGAREVMEHQKSGWLVSAGSPDALASAIRYLLDRPSLRGFLGSKAYERAYREHELHTQIKKLEAIYHSMESDSP